MNTEVTLNPTHNYNSPYLQNKPMRKIFKSVDKVHLVTAVIMTISFCSLNAAQERKPWYSSLFVEGWFPHYEGEFSSDRWGIIGASVGWRLYAYCFEQDRNWFTERVSLDVGYSRGLLQFNIRESGKVELAREHGIAEDNRIDVDALHFAFNYALFGINPIPLFLESDDIQIVASAGFSYLCYTAREIDGREYDSDYTLGFVAGLRFEFNVSDQFGFNLGGKYHFGLSDNFDAVNVDTFDAYQTLNAGFVLHLTR